MLYNELIHRVQDYQHDLSDEESREALELMVAALCTRLRDDNRREFAAELPSELKDIALIVQKTENDTRKNLLKQFMDLQRIDEHHAKKQIKAAWCALRDAVSRHEIEEVKSQLPPRTTALLS